MPQCYDFFGQQICFPTVDDIVKGIQEYIEENLVPALQELINNLLDAVTKTWGEYIENITENIVKGFSGVVDGIVENAGSIFKPVTDYFELFYSLAKDFPETVSGGFKNIVDAITSVPSTISDLFEDFWKKVSDYSSSFQELLSEQVNSITKSISESFDGFVSNIEKFVNTYIEFIDSNFTTLFTNLENLASTIISFTEMVKEFFEKVINTYVEYNKQLLEFYAKIGENNINFLVQNIPKIVQMYLELLQAQWETLYNVISGATASIYGTLADSIEALLTSKPSPDILLEKIRELFGGLATILFQTFRNMIEYEPPITYEKSTKAAVEYLRTLIDFSALEIEARIMETLFSILGDLEVLGTKIPGRVIAQTRPFSSFIRSVYFNMGFGWLTWTIWGDLIRATITEGFQRYYREKYRTTEPTLSMIQEAFRRGFISEDEFKKYLAYLGYEDKWFKLLRDNAFYYLPPSTIQEFYARGFIDSDRAVELLKQYGIREEYVSLFLETAYRTLTLSDVLEAYYRGIWDEKTTKQYLRFMGYRPEDVDIILEVNKRILSYSIVFEAYEWGLIDEKKMSELLYKLGYRGEELGIMLEIGKRRAIADEISTIRTRVLNLFEFGYFTEWEAKTILKSLGIPEDQVDLLLKAKKYEQKLNTINDYVASILREFRDGKIDEATLRILIAPFIQDPKAIEGLIAYQRSLREKKLAYILPPIFENRQEYLRRLINGLNRQIEYLSQVYIQMMDEYDALINIIQAEIESMPKELRPIARKNLERIQQLKKEREEYYALLIADLQFNVYVYQRLLQAIGGWT